VFDDGRTVKTGDSLQFVAVLQIGFYSEVIMQLTNPFEPDDYEFLALAALGGLSLLQVNPLRNRSFTQPLSELTGPVEAAIRAHYSARIPFIGNGEFSNFGKDVSTHEVVTSGLLVHYVAYLGGKYLDDGLKATYVPQFVFADSFKVRLKKLQAEFLHSIVERYQWPTAKLFGGLASHAAWEIVLESDLLEEFYFHFSEEVSEVQRLVALDHITIKKFGWQRWGMVMQSGGEVGKGLTTPFLRDGGLVDAKRQAKNLPPLWEQLEKEAAKRGIPVVLPRGYEKPKGK
jgi:hypothetical protein